MPSTDLLSMRTDEHREDAEMNKYELVIDQDDYHAYISIDHTGAVPNHDITALSMHVQPQGGTDMLESGGELHHEYYLVPHTSTEAVCENATKLMEKYPICFHPISCMPELFGLLGDSNTRVDSIALDAEILYEQGAASMLDVMNTLMTIIRCKSNTTEGNSTSIVVSAGRKTPPAMLRELAKVPHINVLCMRGGDSAFDETCDVVEHLLRGENYIADSIKQMMKSSKRVKPNRDGIHLTARQQQVLDLIKTRGSSNKQIARLLDLSESTVKLHIGQILKKYGCVNRTQLALAANKTATKQQV